MIPNLKCERIIQNIIRLSQVDSKCRETSRHEWLDKKERVILGIIILYLSQSHLDFFVSFSNKVYAITCTVSIRLYKIWKNLFKNSILGTDGDKIMKVKRIL